MIGNSKNLIVKDSRSYGVMQTKSDHRPVIAKINIKWKYISKTITKNHINTCNNTVCRIIKNQTEIASTQYKWTNIVNITKQAAVETLRYVSKMVKYQSHEIKELSKQQQKKENYSRSKFNFRPCKT